MTREEPMADPKFKQLLTTIPAEYTWKATDANGRICVFDNKPTNDEGYSWYGPRWMDIGFGPIPEDWKNTLEKI